MALIGNIIGVSTPIIDALIDLASEANQVDYWRQGRTFVARAPMENGKGSATDTPGSQSYARKPLNLAV